MSNVYTFHDNCEDKAILGNKGANLVTMARLGLPVPPGFILSVKSYTEYKKSGMLPDIEIKQAVAELEKHTGRRLGKELQVSVRSSAPVSMPGMMDTVLNVNDMADMKIAAKQVFDSWDNMRAVEYRRLNNIAPDLGTAVIIQAMVFGNKDANSGPGVVFSRDPSTGQKGLFGEYMSQAQGEELVSGTRTPGPIADLKKRMPAVYAQL